MIVNDGLVPSQAEVLLFDLVVNLVILQLRAIMKERSGVSGKLLISTSNNHCRIKYKQGHYVIKGRHYPSLQTLIEDHKKNVMEIGVLRSSPSKLKFPQVFF